MNTTKDFRDTQKLFSLESAAAALGNVSVWTLRKHVFRGNIKVTRIGRRVFLRSEEVARIQTEGLPSLRQTAKTVANEEKLDPVSVHQE